MTPLGARARCLLVCAGFLAIAFAIDAPALGNAFFNDDALYLIHAFSVQEDPSTIFGIDAQGSIRPVWVAYISALHAFFGIQPLGYFVVGIVLHAANGVLVWRVARRWIGGELGPLAAGFVYLVLFSHSEAVLWIAAHNSALVAFFAMSAMLAHLRAIERRSAPLTLATLALVGAAALTKETGVAVLPWIVIAQARVHGWSSCITRGSLARFAAAAAIVAAPWAFNRAFVFAISSPDGPLSVRAAFRYVTPARVVTAWEWLFEPVAWTYRDARPLVATGILALVLLAAWRMRVLSSVLAGVLLSMAALLPAASTRLAAMNGSRQNVLPTVGAALVVGSFAGLARTRAARVGLAAVLAAFAVANARAIRRLNDAYFRPVSVGQTRFAREVGAILPSDDGAVTLVIEPAITNVGHLREFLFLFQGFASDHVFIESVPRAEYAAWLEARRREAPATRVVAWDETRGLVEATAEPPPALGEIQGIALGWKSPGMEGGYPVTFARIAR